MKKTILLIEDNEKHRFLLEDMLDDAGYNVETAADGKEVDKKMGEKNSFDLIIVDIAVPGFDAIEFIETNKKKYRLLVVSAYIEKVQGKLPDKQRIKKPFDTNDLLKRVKEMLSE